MLLPDGLNVGKEADPHGKRVGGPTQGAVVTITDGPVCDSKMVWWQVKRINTSRPAGRVGRDDSVEWLLALLMLEESDKTAREDTTDHPISMWSGDQSHTFTQKITLTGG